MLKLRRWCQACRRRLPPGAADALICSFECTFCAGCALARFGGVCPNCGGELVRRPRRLPKGRSARRARTVEPHARDVGPATG